MDRPALMLCLSDERTMNRVAEHLADTFEVHQLVDPDLVLEELPKQPFKAVLLEFRLACPEDTEIIREVWCRLWKTGTALRVLSVTPTLAQLFTGMPEQYFMRLPNTQADWERLPRALQ